MRDRSSPSLVHELDRAGRELASRYGQEGIPHAALVQRVVERAGCPKESVFPSDYCYNLVNRSSHSFSHPIFEWASSGRYRYIGLQQAYDKAIWWRPIVGKARVVGHWRNGKPVFDEDPRSR